MPVYTYRREDGTTFEYRQRFLDDPLEVDPTTGQKVVRIVHAAGVIFKGSGFYVNDSKKATNGNLSKPKESSDSTAAETKSETKTEAKTEVKSSAAD
jgi:predicted nucleic acid-binding Zn ribbon protein